jgi:DNA-binding NtrC family response regulator
MKVDVRVIAATNRDLEAAYKNGTFRKDLYFRLNVVTLYVPALRERRSDTPMLVHWFLERYAPGSELHVTSAAMKALMQYDWPGNVRELENCVERAVALGNGQIIDLGDLPPAIASGATVEGAGEVVPMEGAMVRDSNLAATQTVSEGARASSSSSVSSTTDLEDIERATIQRVFQQVKGDKALAGRMLGISRATLYRKLKRYNIGMDTSGSGSPSHALQ